MRIKLQFSGFVGRCLHHQTISQIDPRTSKIVPRHFLFSVFTFSDGVWSQSDPKQPPDSIHLQFISPLRSFNNLLFLFSSKQENGIPRTPWSTKSNLGVKYLVQVATRCRFFASRNLTWFPWTRFLLVNLCVFMCYIHWSDICQLAVL